MFIYVINRNNYNQVESVDKWNCVANCETCKNRFVCFTKQWRTFRSNDDYGIFVEDEWKSYLDNVGIVSGGLHYCCKLAIGKVWDEKANDYVPEII